MLSVLVVDDEAVIVDALYEILTEIDEYPIDIISAHSAEEALEQCAARQHIDLIVTDICLYEMNGVEMVQQFRKEWPQVHVIFLTGFREFEYAQIVANMGNSCLLMKCDGIANVKATIYRELETIIREQQEIIHRLELGEKADLFTAMMAQRNFADLLECTHDNSASFECGEIRNGHPFIMIVIQADSDIDNLSFISVLLKDYLPGVHLWQCPYRSFLCILLQSEGTQARDTISESRVFQVLSYIADMASKSKKSNTSICISHCMHDFSSISDHFYRMLLCIQGNRNNGWVVLQEQMSALSQPSTNFWNAQKLAHIEELILDLNEKDCILEVNYWLKVADEEKRSSFSLMIRTGFLSVLISIASRFELLISPDQFKITGSTDLLKLFYDCFDLLKKRKTAAGSELAYCMKSHIDDHISEDLSLSSLSFLFHYSGDYLSKLFKTEFGETLQDYILRKRVDYAKLSLLKPNLRIHEVSKDSGFGSVKYFNAVFKRFTGVSPGKWRENHSSHSTTD